MAIQFKELKQYLSRIVRISVCFEDGHYENYTLPSDIPDGRYDEMYVFGVGMIDVEFPRDVYAKPYGARLVGDTEAGYCGRWLQCIM